nr:uncharacterized membrane protein At3g27390 isoform X1 [Tanacetum cinerariifolium]
MTLRTKRVGWVLKTVTVLLFPLPLALWPAIAIIGSLLGGVGFGFFSPLIATFEVIGTDHKDKCFHCFVDGCYSTLETSCTVVQDLTDICFHSYFSFMDDLSEEMPADEKSIDISLLKLPKCLFVIPIAIVIDVPLITAVAICKTPYMLIIGWKRLLEDLIGREGPFLETVCVPFVGLAILLWPLVVGGAVIAATISSFGLALYSAMVVHQIRLRRGHAFPGTILVFSYNMFRSGEMGMLDGLNNGPGAGRGWGIVGIIATPPEGGGLKRRLSDQGSIEKAGMKHLTVNKEEKLNDAQVTEDVV